MRVALLFLVACSSPRRPVPDVAAPAEPVVTRDRARDRHVMRQELADLDDMVTNLIAGRHDDAKTFAFAIAQAERHATTAVSERVRVAALAVARSTSLVDACRAAPHVIAACSGCHTGWLPMRSPPFPDDQPTHAASHRWALERARDGLMTATDGPWREALQVFAEQRLARDTLGRVGFDTADERIRAYGEILVACYRCHSDASRTIHASR